MTKLEKIQEELATDGSDHRYDLLRLEGFTQSFKAIRERVTRFT